MEILCGSGGGVVVVFIYFSTEIGSSGAVRAGCEAACSGHGGGREEELRERR